MRHLFILLVAMLCSNCAQLPPSAIPKPLPNKEQAVVFDIDGTLTQSDLEFCDARTDAAKVVSIFANNGYQIFYLSTRIAILSAGIPSWLKENGFPNGSIHVAQTANDRSYPDVFKTRMLKDFIKFGWNIKFAYGNKSTDFKAYTAVGIPMKHVFGLLNKGDTLCQQGDWFLCLKGWTEHLNFVKKSVKTAPTP